MKTTIEIKLGKERHILKNRTAEDGIGCGHCSIMELCSMMGATSRQALCDASLYMVCDDTEQDFPNGTIFKLKAGKNETR